MANYQIQLLAPGDHRLDEVAELFRKLYDLSDSQGSLMPLAENGEQIWRRGIEKTLGRFSQIYVAAMSEQVIGFAWGSLKMLPEYVGGHVVGHINAIYVLPEFKQQGIGRELIGRLEEWFRSRKARSFELHVFHQNDPGLAFWESLDYKKELYQMRKFM